MNVKEYQEFAEDAHKQMDILEDKFGYAPRLWINSLKYMIDIDDEDETEIYD